MSIYNDVMTETNFDKLEKLEAFSKAHGHNVGELAISWLLAHPLIASVIAGAMNGEQIAANVKSAEWKLTAEDVRELDKII
jgi:aryl-alcohol dehydrogenase-like predicted oxidoreductase